MAMTALEEQILKLPKAQKISLMESLWSDLSQGVEAFEVPDWHLKALDETEKRIEEGKEQFEDWAEVKRKLRDA